MSVVDILMPVRNGEPFLVEAMESLLAQTFTDWRLITVDDRSDDNTWEILCTYSKRDERFLCLKNQGAGIVRALNTALAYSRAPFLARMDADDVSDPFRLEKLLRLLDSEPDASVGGSRVNAFPQDGLTPNMRRYIRWQNSLLTPSQIRRERYVESTLTHATAMFRKDVLIKDGGWREGPFPEDLDLWLRLHREKVKFIKHPEILYMWREHGQRETRSSERCTPEAFHLCRVMHLTEEMKNRNIARIAVIGPVGARSRWSRSLKERGFDVTPFAWKPGEPVPDRSLEDNFILAAFGVPNVRAKAREELNQLGQEEERWLFVG
jgi:glycosyltransferase involved in cell wall biosynthesis